MSQVAICSASKIDIGGPLQDQIWRRTRMRVVENLNYRVSGFPFQICNQMEDRIWEHDYWMVVFRQISDRLLFVPEQIPDQLGD